MALSEHAININSNSSHRYQESGPSGKTAGRKARPKDRQWPLRRSQLPLNRGKRPPQAPLEHGQAGPGQGGLPLISLPEYPGTVASLKGQSPFCFRAQQRNSKPGENLPKGPQGSYLSGLEKPQSSDKMSKEQSFGTRQRETLFLLLAEPLQCSRHLWGAARTDPSR